MHFHIRQKKKKGKGDYYWKSHKIGVKTKFLTKRLSWQEREALTQK